MPQDAPEGFAADAIVVTSGARLARRLAALATRAQVSAGACAWAAPVILPWQAFLERLHGDACWTQGHMEVLIQGAQRRVLWQDIIEASPQRDHVLQPAAVVTRAMEAWDLLQAYLLPIFPQGHSLNDDARAFRAWARAYQGRCEREGWLDGACLPAWLATRADRLAHLRGRHIACVGFDETPPAMARLLSALETAGARVVLQPPPDRAGRVTRATLATAGEEVEAAARWARHCLAQDAHTSVGIVVPGLAARRGEVARVLADILVPGDLVQVPDHAARLYSITAGDPLAQEPVVAHGLLLLELALGGLPAARASTLIRSVFLGGAVPERTLRARFDALLRGYQDMDVDVEGIVFRAGACGEAAPTVLVTRLAAVSAMARGAARVQRAPQWARLFSGLLTAAGWPGDRALTSAEHQALSAWRELLSEFAALDPVTGVLTAPGALAHLRRLAQERRFQPSSPEAPIQVLDLAGAADMGFDHLWVSGLHEDAWPPPVQPNPFIPLALQREARMPRSSAERVLGRAEATTATLARSCPDVVFSWPAQEGDALLRPSPLLRGIPAGEPPRADVRRWVQEILGAARIEQFEDWEGPALPAGVDARGGATLFKNQAACPFRAFARHRLRAEGLDETDLGLDAIERGNLVHQVLEVLWQSLSGQAALEKLTEDEREGRIAGAVDEVIRRAVRQRPRLFTPRFTEVERDRLQRLTGEWLALERDRAPFTVVACESRRPFRVGAVTGQLRVDRIDALEDGRQVILDYKTGRVPAHPWEGNRPEEPQLPLYAVTGDDPVAAIAFARVARGNCGFQGAAASDEVLPAVEGVEDWQVLHGHWQRVLLALATQFAHGDARVDPREGGVTCRQCDLQVFCRVDELGLPGDGAADGEAGHDP